MNSRRFDPAICKEIIEVVDYKQMIVLIIFY